MVGEMMIVYLSILDINFRHTDKIELEVTL